jgi:hypothetical protein
MLAELKNIVMGSMAKAARPLPQGGHNNSGPWVVIVIVTVVVIIGSVAVFGSVRSRRK